MKKCSKCGKEFEMCCQTLSCIKREKALRCNACESLYSMSVKKEKEACPICKLGETEKVI